MHISREGVELLKVFEGCKLVAYLDRIADPPVWTIGYGNTGPGVVRGLHISQRTAEEMLLVRLREEFEPGVSRAVHGSPTSSLQFSAMVCLAYNIGLGAFRRSSVRRKHLVFDYAGAADAFRLWVKAGGVAVPGLQRRREAERALYLRGTGVDAA